MRLDASDATQLAARLRVGPREFARAAGAPWWVGLLAEEQGIDGTLFVGRTGPSVGVLVGPEAVTVGRVEGVGTEPGDAHWVLLDAEDLALPLDDASLEALGRLVDAAARAQAPHLVWCRYCGGVYAKVFTSGDEACLDCASLSD